VATVTPPVKFAPPAVTVSFFASCIPDWFAAIAEVLDTFETVAHLAESTYRARVADFPMTERAINPFDDEITVN